MCVDKGENWGRKCKPQELVSDALLTPFSPVSSVHIHYKKKMLVFFTKKIFRFKTVCLDNDV